MKRPAVPEDRTLKKLRERLGQASASGKPEPPLAEQVERAMHDKAQVRSTKGIIPGAQRPANEL